MSTTWEDVQAELAYDHYLQMAEETLEGRSAETLTHFFTEGFSNSQDVTSGIVFELSRLSPADHAFSIGFLSCVLLETIERETISLPILVAGLGLKESDETRTNKIKQLFSSGLNSPRFSYNYFEDKHANVLPLKKEFDAIISQMVPDHHFFKTESNLWSYRERILSYRNSVAHGRSISTPAEVDYILAFSVQWREVVYNGILNRFGLALDENWLLANI